jgi:peroxiredoxin
MAELQGLQLRIDELGRHNTEVVAVVVDPVEKNAKVVEHLKLSYRIVADTERRVIDAYDLRHDEGGEGGIARPATFLIDSNGIVRWRDLTESYRLRPRPEDVLAQVAAIDTH